MLINLVGKFVNCCYIDENCRIILEFRISMICIFGEFIFECDYLFELWINLSMVMIYRYVEDCFMIEKEGEIGFGFLVDVVKVWEQVFFEFSFFFICQIVL